MQAGRRLGAEKPERRQRLSARNLGFTRINSTKDLLAWVNRITSRYYTRQIDSETLKDLLSLAAAFSKILEVREVSEEVERLKDMIEEMEGEDGEIQEFEKRDS
jgi:UDP-glucose 4-epimerase